MDVSRSILVSASDEWVRCSREVAFGRPRVG